MGEGIFHIAPFKSGVKVCPCVVLTLSLGLPSEPCGDPAALDWTRTNSSLVTVATDSVELLTFPSEERSSMAGWFTQGQLERPGLKLSPFPLLSSQLCRKTGDVFWYSSQHFRHHNEKKKKNYVLWTHL